MVLRRDISLPLASQSSSLRRSPSTLSSSLLPARSGMSTSFVSVDLHSSSLLRPMADRRRASANPAGRETSIPFVFRRRSSARRSAERSDRSLERPTDSLRDRTQFSRQRDRRKDSLSHQQRVSRSLLRWHLSTEDRPARHLDPSPTSPSHRMASVVSPVGSVGSLRTVFHRVPSSISSGESSLPARFSSIERRERSLRSGLGLLLSIVVSPSLRSTSSVSSERHRRSLRQERTVRTGFGLLPSISCPRRRRRAPGRVLFELGRRLFCSRSTRLGVGILSQGPEAVFVVEASSDDRVESGRFSLRGEFLR